VQQLLHVLAGYVQSVTIEELGEIGEGVEFTLRRSTVTEVHQVKRQRGNANYWNLGDLRSEGVLEAARRHVADGREYHFVSTIAAQTLQELAELARYSPDVDTFVRNLHDRRNFDYLSSVYRSEDNVYASEEIAWKTLRGTWAHWTGERDLRSSNSAWAGRLITGAPGPAAAVTLATVDQMYEQTATRAISVNLRAHVGQLHLEAVSARGTLNFQKNLQQSI
jgi:hypothetical protein